MRGHLNQNYPTGINPCRCILATNGIDLWFGYWDAPPELTLKISNLKLGSKDLQELRDRCGLQALETAAEDSLRQVQTKGALLPVDLAGGSALINAKLPVNSFAAKLSPILRKYFSNQEDVREIAEYAYVNSNEVTEYDNVLESLLKERLNVQRNTIVQPLQPGKKGEEKVTRAIADFDRERPLGGHLQIIQGSVGSGKSLFMQRYRAVLQPKEDAERTHWAFIDFNSAPPELSDAYEWLCKSFIASIERENPGIDLYTLQTQRGIFSKNIVKRRAIYESLAKISTAEAETAKAKDLMAWQDDVKELTRGLAQYLLGSRQDILVVVMDNVDRLATKNQLDAFQLTLSFMAETRAFVILQMRDETYERFKDKPPLDTFRSGITFHISPPRFIDVVKKRLELSLQYLSKQADETQTYTLESGVRITYPKSELGNFLRELYLELFERRHNISRVLESLAGGDVRKALEMFVSVITSGHLSEMAITSNVWGAKTYPIKEHNVLKILMRTDYRFASEQSGIITNIFRFDRDWQKPDNFLLIEILYFLVMNRKKVGQIRLEGYWTGRHVMEELQKQGYIPEDTLAALNYLLKRQLITADHLSFRDVTKDDSVKISASGFMHIRFLPARLEYLFGVIPTTPVFDEHIANALAYYVERENTRGQLNANEKATAVEVFYKYLFEQKKNIRDKQPLGPVKTGAALVLDMMNDHLQHFWHKQTSGSEPGAELDLV
jgi:hypothetical protein